MKNMGQMGRPKIELDFNSLDSLCGLQCTLSEIASFFHCSEDTVERRIKKQFKMTFAEYYRQKAGTGRISLRRLQFKAAQDGSVSMMIWLGKQWLGQSDKIEEKVETKQHVIFDTEWGSDTSKDPETL